MQRCYHRRACVPVLVAAETSRGQSVYGRWPVRDPIGQGKGIRKHVDAIVTGSGPNGPVAANVLADAGWNRARR
jgi:hypothetical protein